MRSRRPLQPVIERLPYAGLLVAGLLLLAWLLMAEPFRVRQVTITGLRYLPRGQVDLALGAQGQSVFLLNRQQLRRAVQRLSPVAEAGVQIGLPARLTVTISERPPAYRWQSGGTAYLVSADGVVLAPAREPGDLPLVVDRDGRPLAVGEHLDPQVLRAVDFLTRALPQYTALSSPQYEYSRAEGLAVSSDGRRIVFGLDDLLTKVLTLRVLDESLRARGLRPTLIDLRFADHPYIR